jgi:hypothetical protein
MPLKCTRLLHQSQCESRLIDPAHFSLVWDARNPHETRGIGLLTLKNSSSDWYNRGVVYSGGGLSRYAAESRERHLRSVITAHAVHAAPGRG